MSGHSKWSNIKFRKERADAKKGKIFSRLAKEIISAVKMGGPDPKGNARLKLALQKARDANFPAENIERNIKKASSADQADFVEVTYEIYGYGGVGIIVEAMTDNKNRTASDIRIAINKNGGTIANPGAVAFNFDRKGVIQVPKTAGKEDDLFALAIDAGAEDFEAEEDRYIMVTGPSDLYAVKEALSAKGVTVESAKLDMVPKAVIDCNEEDQKANLALMDWLENLDDVDTVYHNMSMG